MKTYGLVGEKPRAGVKKKKIGQTHLLAISFSENEKKSSQNNSLCIYILFWASKGMRVTSKVEKTAWKMTSLK